MRKLANILQIAAIDIHFGYSNSEFFTKTIMSASFDHTTNTPKRTLLGQLAKQKNTKLMLPIGLLAAFMTWFIAFSLLKTGEYKAPNFSLIEDTNDKKTAFFDYLYPMIEKQNQHITQDRLSLEPFYNTPTDTLNKAQMSKLIRLAKRYRLVAQKGEHPVEITQQFIEELAQRIDIVPPSMALAQAASESGWGSSRFALDANNYFGQWCYTPGCGLVPSQRPQGASHEVKAFDSVNHSVKAYISNINTGKAYKKLRQIRAKLRQANEPITGPALALGLQHYSERGQAYIKEILSMIQFNGLTKYDTRQQTSQKN